MLALASRGAVDVATAGRCFHCDTPLLPDARWTATVDGAPRQFCCAGCVAVAVTLCDAGLASLYAARRSVPAASARSTSGAWDALNDPALSAGLVTETAPGESEMSLIVEGMSCGACVGLIEGWLARQPGVLEARVDYASRRARLRWRSAMTSPALVAESLERIGYRVHPYDPARREALARREQRDLLARMSVALLCMMQVMMLALPGYGSADGVFVHERLLLEWASLMLAVPVVFYSAVPFFRGAWRDLASRRVGMDVPIAAGLASAFAASAWATVAGSGAVYYDAVTMFVALVLVARYAELRVRQRAAEAVESLAGARPPVAERLSGWPANASVDQVVPAMLAIGAHVRVRPGHVVPADALVVEGHSEVEEALLTGESRPRPVVPGDRVLEGALNRGGALVLRVEAAGSATRLAGVLRLVDLAAMARPRVVRLADRAAGMFVAALLVIGLATALAWAVVDAGRVLPTLFALWVVSCPCALSLATPAAIAAAAGALGRRQVVFARTDALESLAGVTHLVFDKTGTLTCGRWSTRSLWAAAGVGADRAFALAAALEAASEHPIASAFAQGTLPTLRVHGWRRHGGRGVEGEIDGVAYRLGRVDFVAELSGDRAAEAQGIVPEAAGATQVALGSAAGIVAVFALEDALRTGAREAVEALQSLGVTVLLRSGDTRDAAQSLASMVGIADAQGQVTPEDKVAEIARLQAEGARVAMVGDGLNDTPALALADVSISLGDAAPLAQTTADVVILSNAPGRIAEAIVHARRTRRVIVQNLGWALAYNLVAIPAAAAGLVTPLFAAIGMSVSSLVVVGNALRAGRTAGCTGMQDARARRKSGGRWTS